MSALLNQHEPWCTLWAYRTLFRKSKSLVLRAKVWTQANLYEVPQRPNHHSFAVLDRLHEARLCELTVRLLHQCLQPPAPLCQSRIHHRNLDPSFLRTSNRIALALDSKSRAACRCSARIQHPSTLPPRKHLISSRVQVAQPRVKLGCDQRPEQGALVKPRRFLQKDNECIETNG